MCRCNVDKRYSLTLQDQIFSGSIGAGEGIRILDPLKACLMGSQKLKKYIESTLQIDFKITFQQPHMSSDFYKFYNQQNLAHY